MEERVKLHLYDLSKGMARKLSPVFLDKQIEGVYHAGLVVGGVEYTYGPRIWRSFPGQTVFGMPDSVVDLGSTTVPSPLRENFLFDLEERYNTDTYDVLHNNSITFVNDFCNLLTGHGIPAELQAQTHDIVNSPIVAQLLQAFSNSEEGTANSEDLLRQFIQNVLGYPLATNQQLPAQNWFAWQMPNAFNGGFAPPPCAPGLSGFQSHIPFSHMMGPWSRCPMFMSGAVGCGSPGFAGMGCGPGARHGSGCGPAGRQGPGCGPAGRQGQGRGGCWRGRGMRGGRGCGRRAWADFIREHAGVEASAAPSFDPSAPSTSAAAAAPESAPEKVTDQASHGPGGRPLAYTLDGRTTVHFGVSCDVCGAHPIVGVRYKSAVLPDWDACSNCIGHEAAAAAAPFLEYGTGEAKKLPTDAGGRTIHMGVVCDVCEKGPVIGTRFKSSKVENWDACAACAGTDAAAAAAPFLKLGSDGDAQPSAPPADAADATPQQPSATVAATSKETAPAPSMDAEPMGFAVPADATDIGGAIEPVVPANTEAVAAPSDTSINEAAAPSLPVAQLGLAADTPAATATEVALKEPLTPQAAAGDAELKVPVMSSPFAEAPASVAVPEEAIAPASPDSDWTPVEQESRGRGWVSSFVTAIASHAKLLEGRQSEEKKTEEKKE